MANGDKNIKGLVIAITDFLLTQSDAKVNPSSARFLRVAVACLERAYRIQLKDYRHAQHSITLSEVFQRTSRPVSIRDHKHAEKCKMEGNILMKAGKYQQAELEYTQAIYFNEWNAVYFCNRAAARIQLGNYRKAVADCNRALALDHRYTKAYMRLGQAYCMLNQPERAARSFRKALGVEPSNDNALKSLDLVVAPVGGLKSEILRPLSRFKQNLRRLTLNFPLLNTSSSSKYESFVDEPSNQSKKSEILGKSEPLD